MKEINIKYPPVLYLLGVAFVVLKLVGEIAWPWVWVLAPFWAPWALIGFVLVFIILIKSGGR